LGGKGIFLGTILVHQTIELAIGTILGGLEQQVFKEMRKAGLALGLVGGTDLVAYGMKHNG
jgi:fructose-1-phosphate kinase PfkB-like protein